MVETNCKTSKHHHNPDWSSKSREELYVTITDLIKKIPKHEVTKTPHNGLGEMNHKGDCMAVFANENECALLNKQFKITKYPEQREIQR